MGRPFVALVPAYEVDESFPDFIRRLCLSGFRRVVIVDDGSSEQAQPYFAAAAKQAGVTLLRHEKNLGKGAALRDGFQEILRGAREALEHAGVPFPIVVTADADGQHDATDCRLLAKVLDQPHPKHLKAVLGVRRFSLFRGTPWRSWLGNRWMTILFFLFYRRWLTDTQTGLRAFELSLVKELLDVEEEGYAYETAVLARILQLRYDFYCVKVRTIYKPGNTSSHFRVWQDTVLIWKALLRSVRRK